jgi:hypothetical protein
MIFPRELDGEKGRRLMGTTLSEAHIALLVMSAFGLPRSCSTATSQGPTAPRSVANFIRGPQKEEAGGPRNPQDTTR